jgi:thioesterase domain-containing protein
MTVPSPEDLQDFLHARIPLSVAMGVRVAAAAPEAVTVTAPLAPNVNHRATAFGGSASALAMLAAWSVVFVGLRAEGQPGRIVIRRNSMSFDRPIEDDFSATAHAPPPADWARLLVALRKGRPGRIRVRAALACSERLVAEFEGEFAVLPLAQAEAADTAGA